MKKLLFVLVLVTVLVLSSQGAAQENFLIKVSAFTPEEVNLLSNSGIKAYARTADYYLAEASSQDLDILKSSGLTYEILDNEPEYSLYYFVYARPGEDISKYLTQIKEKTTVLDAKGDKAIVKGNPRKIEELTALGLELRLVNTKPIPLRIESSLPAAARSKTLAYDPLIAEIIGKVTTAELAGWDSSLSGEHPVTIGGNLDTLLTRYTYTNKCDRAAQYIKEKFESFGLTAWYDTLFIFPASYYIMDIVSSPDGNTAWLGGLICGIWKTTNAGANWRFISGTENYNLWALAVPSPETLYGAGNNGLIIKSTDAGETWFALSSPTSNHLRGVYFENSQCGWVSGYYGSIYLTTDGGASWINQSNGTGNLYEITFTDSNNGWVVGTGRILHTTNRGTNWVTQTSGTTGIIFGLDFATPGKGWVCGQYGYLRYTTNAGTSWNSVATGTSRTFYMVSSPDSLHVWAAGLSNALLHTTDGGSTWSSQNASAYNGQYYEVHFQDSLRGWLTGLNDLSYTSDGGNNWEIQMNQLQIPTYKWNVVAVKPGQTQPGKECLITAHYDDASGSPDTYAPGADDNASGTAAVITAAHVLKDYQFDYTLKFVAFSGEEQGLLGSAAYAGRAALRGDSIIGVYNFDMISWENNGDNVIELHAGTGASSGALADIMTGVITDYSLPLVPHKITSGATDRSDHASFWAYGYPAILGIEDMTNDFNAYYHSTSDLIGYFDFPYFTNFAKAGIASLATLAQPVQQFTYGDADGDGKVMVGDVIYLINYLFKGGPAPDPLLRGDANCDGQVKVADVIYIINYLFKGGPVPGC